MLITTSYVNEQAYKEVVEDEHLILFISVTDFAGALRRNAIMSSNINEWFETLDEAENQDFNRRVSVYHARLNEMQNEYIFIIKYTVKTKWLKRRFGSIGGAYKYG